MRIEIENFQAIEQAVMDFDSPITFITGESNNGKTAILRAIKFFLMNKRGDYFVREGADNMKVSIENDAGIISWEKRRNGGSFEAIYDCLGKTLEKTGGRPVQEVMDFMRISAVASLGTEEFVNFWDQMSYPFLLDKSDSQLFDFVTFMDSEYFAGLVKIQMDMKTDLKEKKVALKELTVKAEVLQRDVMDATTLLRNVSADEEFGLYEDVLEAHQIESLIASVENSMDHLSIISVLVDDTQVELGEELEGLCLTSEKLDTLILQMTGIKGSIEQKTQLIEKSIIVDIEEGTLADDCQTADKLYLLVSEIELIMSKSDRLESTISCLDVECSECEALIEQEAILSETVRLQEKIITIEKVESVVEVEIDELTFMVESYSTLVSQIRACEELSEELKMAANDLEETEIAHKQAHVQLKKDFSSCPLCGAQI